MIKTANDAMVIVPMIKDYLDVGVRNDEQLIKLAAIVQRIVSSNTSTDENGGGFALSDDERKQLMEEAERITKELNSPIQIVKQ